MTAILIAILVIAGLILGCMVLFLINLRALLLGITAFATPAKEGEPSPLDQHIYHIANIFADQVGDKAMQKFTGAQGAQARREKAVEGAMALDVINMAAPPWLQAILQVMPELRKKISQNPNLIGPAMQMLAKNNGQGDQAQEQLDFSEFGKL